MKNVAYQEIEHALAVVYGEQRVSWGGSNAEFVCECRNLGPVLECND